MWNCKCASDARMLGYNRLSSIEWRWFSRMMKTLLVCFDHVVCSVNPVCLVHLVDKIDRQTKQTRTDQACTDMQTVKFRRVH